MRKIIRCPECKCKIALDISTSASRLTGNVDLDEPEYGKGVSIEKRILKALKEKGAMTIRQIVHSYHHEFPTAELRRIMLDLAGAGLVERIDIIPARGRPTIGYKLP